MAYKRTNHYAKVRALLLYITDQFRNRSEASRTKLNKAFYFIDFGHYALHGKPITEFVYKKQQWGPIAYGLPDHLESLEMGQDLNRTPVQFHSEMDPQNTYVPLVEVPKLEDHFTEEEVETIQRTVASLRDSTAMKDSQTSHYHNAWITGEIWDDIPLDYAITCAFPWLGYYGSDENEEDYKETLRLREIARRHQDQFSDRESNISFG